MAEDITKRPLHSAQWFGDARDYWWNDDYFALLARRWRLAEQRHVLDVGCGVGHWGRLLARHLPSDARLTGIDREPEWVGTATGKAVGDKRFRYVVGEVESLPFPNNQFDLTTCQTVLIHVADAAAALREMIRVTRPGGLLVVVEPNNLAAALVMDREQREGEVEHLLTLLRFRLLCDRGSRALGTGDHSVGDVLAAMFGQLGLVDVQASLNDKAGGVLPPYEGAEQRAYVDELDRMAEREHWIWPRAQTLRNFVAGGGAEHDFEPLWQRVMAEQRRVADQIRRGTYAHPGGGVCYCVSGRKPA
jgi:SAM-dependent methyltransferase